MDDKYANSRVFDLVYDSNNSMIVFVNDSIIITQTSNIKLDLSPCLTFVRSSGVNYVELLAAITKTKTRFPCMLIYACYRTRLNDHMVLYDNDNGVYSTNMNCTFAELVNPTIQYAQSTNFFRFFYINFNPYNSNC